jgi:hypothetical protein
MVLFGYSLKQWAIVFGRYPLKNESMTGMLECRIKWKLAHINDPGEVSIAGCAPTEDWDAVSRVVSNCSIPWMATGNG